MTDNPLALAADFPDANESRWRALVDAALKGGEFERRLVSHTADGIAIQPLYQRVAVTAGAAPARAALAWRISQRVDHPDAKAANALALEDLVGGADLLTLTFSDSAAARGFGLAPTIQALDTALADVDLKMIALRLDPSPKGHAALITDLVERRNLAPAGLQIDFGLDPIGQAAIAGRLPSSSSTLTSDVANAAVALAGKGYSGPFITVDLRPAHEAGASEAEELAVALSTGLQYLRALEAAGMTLDAARRAISFTVALDADELLGISKLRALRRLWSQIEVAAGLTAEPIRIHAETAWRMATRRDPAVNMLRATLAGFVAGVAGADTLTILPHTLALGLPDATARRIARNIQHVLLEECQLARVIDPAGGSGAFETLTSELMTQAWAQMQEIERQGGIIAALESGFVAARIAKTRASRDGDLARRKLAITGTSEFPPLDAQTTRVLDVARSELAATTPTFPPLASHRTAEPFEALVDVSATFAKRTGTRPKVFLATLGPLAEHSVRKLWITNLLAVADIEAVEQGNGFTNSADVGAAFARSGATVACICGNDQTYAELGEATAAALTNAGARGVYLAGRPGTLDNDLTKAGMTGYFAAGQDIVAALSRLQEVLCVDAS